MGHAVRCAHSRLFKQDPGPNGDLENHLRRWITDYSVPKYDPQRNDSFAKWVFTGWRSNASIQQYMRQFKLPTQEVIDADGETVKKIVRFISIDHSVRAKDGKERPLSSVISRDRRNDRQPCPQDNEDCDIFGTLAKETGVAVEHVLDALKVLALPKSECTNSDERCRREAMLLLLRTDISYPDHSSEFQRREWWNRLVAGDEEHP